MSSHELIKLKYFSSFYRKNKRSYNTTLHFILQLVFTFALQTTRKKNSFKTQLFYTHFRLIQCQLVKLLRALCARAKPGLLRGQVVKKTNPSAMTVSMRRTKRPRHPQLTLLKRVLIRNHIHPTFQPNLPRLKNGCLIPGLNKNHISFKDLNGYLREKHNHRKYLEDCQAASLPTKWVLEKQC